MATPLVDWEKLTIPAYCTWFADQYGIRDVSPEAQQRATALLLAHLDGQQRDDYLRMRRFAVRGASGAVYIMGPELYPTALVNGQPRVRYCAPPHRQHFDYGRSRYDLPMEDVVLTWKLFIEGDEKGFLAVAMPTALAGC